MANIKGITIEIEGNTTKLTTALKNANNEIKSSQSSLKELDKLLKLDPGNVDLLKQKQEALTSAIENTRQKLELEKQALEQLKAGPQTEETILQQQNLTREIVSTEQSLQSLEQEYREFGSVSAQQLQAVGGKMQEVGGKITSMGTSMMPVTAAIVGLGTAAVKTASEFDTAMSKVQALSGATGEEFDALRDKAREMGENTKYSAKEAAEAFSYMALA